LINVEINNMRKNYTTIKLFLGYMLILLFMLISNQAMGQSPCGNDDLCVVQFNAGFNEANKVPWVIELKDCENTFIDIGTDAAAAGKYKIVVVPTILIFNGGTEVARFQANIMMKMETEKKDVQGKIDEILMDAF
tara:strand:+ start:325 stop:729 length:405 start_codon:yes stop_codon:yes gene_type:complete